MRNVKLFGRMNRPLGRGPSNGMYALQKSLGQRSDDSLVWLSVVGRLEECEPDDLVWFWNWEDKKDLVRWDVMKRPWIAGPNILFELSWAPRQGYAESYICDSPNCRMLFTESDWYARLIREQLGPKNQAPIAIWPYPIDPMPEGPLPAEYDLLIYAKSGPKGLDEELAKKYPRSIVIRYGEYERDQLWEAARRSRCCVYLSSDDRGPLALAEILLCGCPSIGIERGAPWPSEEPFAREPGHFGIPVESLSIEELVRAVEFSAYADARFSGGDRRQAVRRLALAKFSPARVGDQVVSLLNVARDDYLLRCREVVGRRPDLAAALD